MFSGRGSKVETVLKGRNWRVRLGFSILFIYFLLQGIIGESYPEGELDAVDGGACVMHSSPPFTRGTVGWTVGMLGHGMCRPVCTKPGPYFTFTVEQR